MKRNTCGEEYVEIQEKHQRLLLREEELAESGWYFKVGDKVQIPLDYAFVSFNNHFQPHGHCVISKFPFVVQVSWRDGVIHGQIVVANLQTRTLSAVYIANRGTIVYSKDMSSLSKDILDDYNTGERWDGTVCDASPCGWGCYYDEDNHLLFEGFRLSSCDVCYGIYYQCHLETQLLYYEGMIYNGEHFGMGRFFNRHGEKEYEGEWIYDSNLFSEICRVVPQDTEVTNLLSLTKQILFDNYSGAYFFSIHIHQIWKLEQIVIGDYCMVSGEPGTTQSPLALTLSYLPNLRLLQIGNHSLTNYNMFSISCCPQLNRIFIGNTAFVSCWRLVIESRKAMTLLSRFTSIRRGKYWFWIFCMCYCRFV